MVDAGQSKHQRRRPSVFLQDVDGLCEGMRKIRFAGKHTRFAYDSEEPESNLQAIVEAHELDSLQPRLILIVWVRYT